MKTSAVILIVIACMISLAACNAGEPQVDSGQKTSENPGTAYPCIDSPDISDQPAEGAADGTPGTDAAEPDGIIQKEGDNVAVSFPASFFSDIPDFDPDTYTEGGGFIKTVVNTDGSVTVTMSQNRYEELIEETRITVDTTISGLIAGPQTPYIMAITAEADYSAVTVDVDKALYDEADINPSFLIGVAALSYRALFEMTMYCEITYRDAATGDTIKSVLYPEDLQG